MLWFLYAIAIFVLGIHFGWGSGMFLVLYVVPAVVLGWLDHTGRIKTD
jgi:hypothetical protein